MYELNVDTLCYGFAYKCEVGADYKDRNPPRQPYN